MRRFLFENFSSAHVRRKPWRAVNQLGAYLMRDSGPWLHQFVTRPARSRSNQLLIQITRGRDPDTVRRWPDYRRPHVWQW